MVALTKEHRKNLQWCGLRPSVFGQKPVWEKKGFWSWSCRSGVIL